VTKKNYLDALNIPAEYILAHRFEVIGKLGGGWEGEVYSVRELATGIERAAKIFFPQRNLNNKSAKFYARKLHKLRYCTILIKYLTQEKFRYRGHELTILVSEFVEGETLDQFLLKQKGQRLQAFQALHLLHALAKGLEEIHLLNEYHGDLHTGNVIVQRYGLGFDLKLIDMFHWKGATNENIRDDVCNLIRIFYDCLGGAKHYRNQPKVVKDICCGLKRNLILRKFKTAGQIRTHLENLEWND
jgi:serine/threonine protein kinase